MTALDRALIKAYSHDRRTPTAARSRASRAAVSPPPSRPEAPRAATATMTSPRQQMETGAASAECNLPQKAEASTFQPQAAMTAVETLIGAYYEPPSVEELYAPYPTVYQSQFAVPERPPYAAIQSPRPSVSGMEPAQAPTVEAAPTAAVVSPAVPSETKPLSAFATSSTPPAPEPAFRPLLEVDRFAWPEMCDSLDSLLAQAELDFASLAEQLGARAASGEKVIAFAGCGLGAGCTTALLCVTRRLATRNIKAVVVDANFVNPQLARQLGVSAQVGWDDVLSGDLPLGEVLIASPSDSLALLPWRQKATPGSGATGHLRAAVTFGILRDHFDLVLIDAGPMADEKLNATVLAYREAAGLSGVYLVYDGRATTLDQAATIAERIEASGAAVYGAVENFSASASVRPNLSVYGSEA